ncbi:unnamed protein product [Prunus brigantina]
MADYKAEFSSMSTDIAKLQASVTLLVNHISTATPKPSSTSAILSSSSTPSLQAGLLPNPSRDSKFQGHLGLPSSSRGTSMVRFEPIFSTGSASKPHYTQRTMGSPLVDATIPPPPPRPKEQNVVHRNLGFEIARHPKPTALDCDGCGDPTLFVDWISAIEDYFEWYDMSNAQRIRFAKLKLEELAVTVSRFIHGLRDDLKHEVSRSRPDVLEDAYCQALGAETFVATTFRIFWSTCNRQPNSSHHRYADGVFRTI